MVNEDDQRREGEANESMGLAPVFAAAFAAACCLALPFVLTALTGGAAAAALGQFDLMSLFIIGFALGGVGMVVLAVFRRRKAGP